MSKNKNKAPLFSPRHIMKDIVRITAGVPGLLWYRPKIIYENENARKRIRGGALIASNHIGVADPIYVMYAVWYRRHRFICKKEMVQSRGGVWLKMFGCIPIDAGGDVSFSGFRDIINSLKSGEVVSVFPEGHVSTGSELPATFKSGVILMSHQSGCPIIPLYIKPKKHFYERLTVAVGEGFNVREKYGERPKFSEIDEAASYLMEKETELKNLTEQVK